MVLNRGYVRKRSIFYRELICQRLPVGSIWHSIYMVGEREGGSYFDPKKLLRKCHAEQSTIERIGRYSTSAMSSASSDKELHAC